MVWFCLLPEVCKVNAVVWKYTFCIHCSEFLIFFWYNFKRRVVLSLYWFTKKYLSHS